VAQVVESLPRKCEALSSNPILQKQKSTFWFSLSTLLAQTLLCWQVFPHMWPKNDGGSHLLIYLVSSREVLCWPFVSECSLGMEVSGDLPSIFISHTLVLNKVVTLPCWSHSLTNNWETETKPCVVAHVCNPSCWRGWGGRSVSSRSTWAYIIARHFSFYLKLKTGGWR
jgi:hypothetical protein